MTRETWLIPLATTLGVLLAASLETDPAHSMNLKNLGKPSQNVYTYVPYVYKVKPYPKPHHIPFKQ